MSVLIAYESVEGQTAKIAKFIEALAQDEGYQVQLVNTSDRLASVSFEDVDTVILAASVHERRHPKMFETFLATETKAFESRRTLMISVSMSAAFPDGLEEAQEYLDEMKMRTQLNSDVDLLVAGAIRSKNYGYYETQVLKHVVLRGQGFDASIKEHEFTDWSELEDRVSAFLDGEPL